MKKKGVDIRDVAALAGVSVGSASRVINGADNVSNETREKVERAISVLNYQPNYAAKALRSRTSKTIGCLLTDVTNPLYAKLFRALEERLRKDGYMLLLANGLNDAEREIETLNLFRQRGMDGVIVASGNERHEGVLKTIAGLPMPVVILDRDMSVQGGDTLLFDHTAGMKEVMAHLFSQGHSRVALVLWQAKNRPVRRRIEGYKQAHKSAGVELPDMIVQGESAISSVYAEISSLLKRSRRPTAIVAQGTYTLSSTLRAIADQGLRVPEDISVVTIGDTNEAKDHRPPISVLNVDSQRVAELTAELLSTRMAEANLAPRSIKVDMVFSDRGSIALQSEPGRFGFYPNEVTKSEIN